MKIKTYIIEYADEKRVWETEIEAYNRESAREEFQKGKPNAYIRECYEKDN